MSPPSAVLLRRTGGSHLRLAPKVGLAKIQQSRDQRAGLVFGKSCWTGALRFFECCGSGPDRDIRLASRADRKSTRLNSSHEWISYAVFCLKKKNTTFGNGTNDGVSIQDHSAS